MSPNNDSAVEYVLSFNSSAQAEIALNTLKVDPEPPRSRVNKTLRVEENQLIGELTRMFHKTRSSGKNISLVIKRYDGRTKPISRRGGNKEETSEPEEYLCLLRAKVLRDKISTVVPHKDVNKFQLAFANLLRGNMDGLKKLKKSKMKTKTAQ